MRDRERRMFGPFVVAPLLVDQRAFDAYALLVEAGGRRLRYSGHAQTAGLGGGSSTSRLGVCAPRSLRAHDSAVRRSTTRPSRESSETFRKLCRETTGMMRACYSCQHIDRLVTLCRAAKRAGRVLILDLYTAVVAAAKWRRLDSEPF
jgi:ribonuclease J